MTARPDAPVVLVVDDDPRVRDLVSVVLRSANYQVLSAASPDEALAIVGGATDIALVLSDIVMPGMSGYDLADEIRAIRPSIRLAFMSGFASDALQHAASALCVTKPFTVESLLSVVERAINAPP
jgi:two-component system cell cycle sensor histidine kinase/response regulator CckA